MFVIAGIAADLDHLAIIHARGVHTAVKRLDPLGIGRGYLQTHGDVGGYVIPAHTHRIGVDHVFLDKDRHARRSAAQINTGGTQLLLILDNVGADVTALLAGLGIGGIAIGIAAQGIFRDLFSSLSIVIDKPFQVGDTVRYGESWGIIEDIGLKTTRVRSKSGEQMIISNTNLLDYEIHNMQRMSRRRMETMFGVIYQTDPDLAEKVPEIVAEIVKNVQAGDFDYCSMAAFGPSSLDYELVFYSLQPDFNRSMAARSRVLLALFRGLQEHGLEFAYPTQTLYIEGMTEKAA